MNRAVSWSRRLGGAAFGLLAFFRAGSALAGTEPAERPPAGAAGSGAPESGGPAATSTAMRGSLATMAPLGAGRVGMSVGGGVAVLLPFYSIEAGVGLSERVDLMGRFESVAGVLHYPSFGVRVSPVELGGWRLGFGFAVNYAFFGIKTDQVNLTSTFYLSASAGVSRPVTRFTDLTADVTGELDLFDYERLDGEGGAKGNVHYDATIFRLGMKTKLTEDLDGFLRARVRVPIETLVYEAMSFVVIPSIEVGGTFVF